MSLSFISVGDALRLYRLNGFLQMFSSTILIVFMQNYYTFFFFKELYFVLQYLILGQEEISFYRGILLSNE